jgi:putative metallohydrolase (TIGR04338 family)
MARDSQRQKVYNAETAAFGWDGPTIEWSAVEAYAAKVMKSAYVRRKYGEKKITVLPSRGRGAHAIPAGAFLRGGSIVTYDAQILVSRSARREWVIIHEMAHHYAALGCRHGWKFCEVYLDLVRHFLGKDAHDALKASFKSHKVRYSKPVKRTFTPEQRKQMADRMAAVRAAKVAKQTEAAA